MVLTLVLTLPIPSPGLSPNAHGHWRTRHKLTRKHKDLANLVTRLNIGEPKPTFTGYTLAFFWPTSRRRDDDNASARCKAYRDGIAMALGVDDSTLVQMGPPAMAVDKAKPRLEITLIKKLDL